MTLTLVIVFIVAYSAIAFEHSININKSASALLGAGVLWSVYALCAEDASGVHEALNESVAATAQIVFFLMAAMAIVEVVDAHNGFDVVTRRIRTTSLSRLIWVVGLVTFFLSAILDNLTTTIVMISLLRKLLTKPDDRLLFAGMVVIAANAGGAWSPIGDVTTTMLWIGGQISSTAVILSVFLPSLVSALVPLAIAAYWQRGQKVVLVSPHHVNSDSSHVAEQKLMLFLGLGILIAVPAFKAVTHLPPFMGILLGLGVLWMVGDIIHRHKTDDTKHPLTLVHALSRIDMSSIVFFVGILLAVAVLEHTHILASLAKWLDSAVGRQDIIVLIIGIVSAIVDNVPLVAAAMGMYDLSTYPQDHFLWEFLAYCAGTGGSILIIGSAAGVAAMGLEKIHFFWYFKRISGLALIGYLLGAGTYLLQYQLLV